MNTDNRWAWVEVDLGAIQKNVALLAKQAGKAQLWATVKANGYGHGAVQVAHAALVLVQQVCAWRLQARPTNFVKRKLQRRF